MSVSSLLLYHRFHHSVSPASISGMFYFFQCRASTVIPVVPALSGDSVQGKQCFFLFPAFHCVLIWSSLFRLKTEPTVGQERLVWKIPKRENFFAPIWVLLPTLRVVWCVFIKLMRMVKVLERAVVLCRLLESYSLKIPVKKSGFLQEVASQQSQLKN